MDWLRLAALGSPATDAGSLGGVAAAKDHFTLSMSATASSKLHMSFDEWVQFVFDHSVADDIKSAWYFDNQLDDFWDEWGEQVNPEQQLKYATNLFQNPSFLLETYSPEQISEGLWFLLSGHSDFSLADFIWNTEVSWPLREECIIAMVRPFQIIFTRIPELDVCVMWWDLIRCFDDDCDARVKATMLQALTEILQIPVLACQLSALHGLGHLAHSGKRAVIENYLRRNTDLGPKTKDFAMAAIEGKVL